MLHNVTSVSREPSERADHLYNPVKISSKFQVNQPKREISSQFKKKYGFEKNTFEVLVTRRTRIFILTINRAVQNTKYYKTIIIRK